MSRMPSNMSAQRMFSTVPAPTIQRSTFDRSHTYKTTLDAGLLYPVLVDEILPGDNIRLDATFFARLNTLRHPLMDNIHFDAFAFVVPMRQIWDNFQKFMGEQIDPDDSIDYLIPRLSNSEPEPIKFNTGTIYDYFGLPVDRTIYTTGDNTVPISALPLRAYNWIWNSWFRDENLQDSVPVSRGDGPDSYLTYSLLPRGKRHDYFTSALPWAQKGDPVMLPLGTQAPVVPDESGVHSNVPSMQWGVSPDRTGSTFIQNDGSLGLYNLTEFPSSGVVAGWVDSGLVTDLSAATAISVNDLRTAVAVQQLLELYARGGTRYVELLKAEFGVVSPDFRLQRPEYLGGSSTMLNISTVPQTAPTSEDSPQANLAAYGTVSDKLRLSYNSTEHQILIVMVNVRADITYQQQINRMWTRRTRYDFYHPAFAHLGEQAVFGYEINFIDGMPSDFNNSVFGYQERYAEYRYKPSLVTGKMRSAAPGTLDSWHLALDFDNNPVYLNEEFIVDDPPIDRAIAVVDEPQFNLDCWFQYRHTRPMPVRSIPGLRRF